MDRLPSSAGGAPDGAFERFLTAAIATIITIMFSWRLLAEEEEASGATGFGSSPRKPLQYSIDKNSNFHNKSPDRAKLTKPRLEDLRAIDLSLDEGSVLNSRLADDQQVVHEDVVYDRHNPVQERLPEAIPVADDSLSSISRADDSLTVDTLTTWDEYKWEEETGDEEPCVIKTRRTVRDFISNPNRSLNLQVNNDSQETQSLSFGASPSSNSSLSPNVPFSQRFANFEYKDTGGDSGYIDLYPDVESDDDTDSSDDEHVYEIQVSDSDSDSEERGGGFYGVTSLDTIMEEYESDASDLGEEGPDPNARGEGGPLKEGSDQISAVGNDKTLKSCDNICDISEINQQAEFTGSNNSSVKDTNLITSETSQSEVNNDHKTDQITQSGMLLNKIEINAKCQLQQSEPPLKRTEADDIKTNLPLDGLNSSDTKLNRQNLVESKVAPSDTVCDLNINEGAAIDSNMIQGNVNLGSDVKNTNSEINDEIYKSELSSHLSKTPENKKENLTLKLAGDDYKISEIEDDSLPPSPVRTCALDNLAEEPFSDTESCSSESVITVLSVKSNDSDSYIDRNNNANNPQSNLPVINVDQASGESLSSAFSGQTTEGLGKYETYSLVSGFLNDSLNSLLSANTGSIENESDADSSSGKELHEQESENQSENINMNGKATSDDSCISSAESLPAVDEMTQINAHISENGHIDSTDSLNTPNDQIDNADICEQTESDRHIESDNSSDSSDPPLREYDPDDDDLAAFQFNLDSDDDSFFLVIADNANDDEDDEGKLRNFQTFTNLNSVGLSPEYGDAVISHALQDDARGFKFSHTEDVSTQFKKRTYFTERSNLSDSDARSDGPLSPITSEDEENKSEESTEKPISVSVNQDHFASPSKLPNLSSYADAEISIAKAGNESENESKRANPSGEIDFKKYIIQSDLSPISEHVPFSEENTYSFNKEQNKIDQDYLVQDHDRKFVIDSDGDKVGSLSVNEMNNLQDPDGLGETLSSLTEKIEYLTRKSAENVDLSNINTESKNENKVSEETELNKSLESESVKESRNLYKETSIDEELHGDSKSKIKDGTEGDVKKAGKRIKIETNIDDILETESINDLKNRSNSSIETNIDDVLNEISDIERETKKQTRKSNRTTVTPSKSHTETNIDDIFDEQFTVTTQVPVHSTPLKEEWQQRRETNIDDILESESVDSQKEKKIIVKQKSKLETSVDDLLNDLNSVSINENRLSSDNDSPLESDDLGQSNLSYETFVDNLFENDSPLDSSQTSARPAGTVLTSESAIKVEKSRDLQSSASHPRGVQPENTPVQLKSDEDNSLTLNIGELIDKTNDPKQKGIIHAEQIVNTDNNVDNCLDKIEKDTKEIQNKTTPPRHEIGTNYRKIYEEPEKFNSNDRNLVDRVNNEVCYSKSIENNKLQNRENCNNVTESVESILSPNNFEKDNRESLQNNLNASQLDFKDQNVSTSLPKPETLNNVKQNTHVGHSPGRDDRYNYKRSDISSVEEPSSTRSPNNTENISNIGIQIDDSLLKSEEECDINDVELKIIEHSDNVKFDHENYKDEQLDSIGSCSLVSDDDSLNSLEESFHSLQDTYNAARLRGLSDSEVTSRVVRTPATKPSDLLLKSKDLKGVKRRVYKHNLKKYTSILQQPVTNERVNITFENPHKQPSLSRLKVLKSREKFLSAENLSHGSFEDKFLQHRTSLASTPRKYLKRHEVHQQSTESLPSDMATWNMTYGSNTSMDNYHSLPSPRHIEELYSSRYSSANSSYEKADYDKLHANCMFSPGKREEIRHTRESLENMFEQLLRYGSVSSLATETDLDADVNDDVNAREESLQDTYYLSFQYPLERAASMSAITGPSESHRLPRKPGKGRFANRKVPKSKSLQTLETNLDDVFDDTEQPGQLSRTPSEHELRVSKSLSKLNVPDWFRKSSFSRSGSTQSLFTYTRTGSTSTVGSSAYPPSLTTSPSPSATPLSNAVIIQKRVTPTSTVAPAARLLRAPMLPTTPEKAPIHNTPQLPSDKFRKQDKKENLKPIAIVPFAKLREMFEKKAQDDAKSKSSVSSPTDSKSPVTSPTKEKPSSRVRFEPPSPTKETVIDSRISDYKPVQNNRTISPPPPVPERKPILTDHSVKQSESSTHAPRRTQVHFSDENHVSRSQEQNTNSLRQNGTASNTSSNTSSSTSSRTVKKPQSLRASLPQFRFRRPGRFATPAAASKESSSQSKKGKNIANIDDIEINGELPINFPPWLHALELKTKTDGETLFEFLQKRRYSSILENGFAEQLNELQDRTFNFPVMALGRHSNQNGDLALDGSPDLHVILTNAHADNVSNGYLESKLRGDASVDEILDGLLLLDGHRTGRMRLDENGRIVPRTPDDFIFSPDTPPGFSINLSAQVCNPSVCENGNVDDDENSDYNLVKCEYPSCRRETNLKEAKQFFKTCHSCFTYYCSRHCRKLHWESHKRVCIYSRINSACKHVIKFINKQPHLQYQCSRIARRGYLSQGRGCVVFAFPDISSSEDFLIYGMDSLWVPPVYICLKELPHATMLGSKLGILTDTCKQYNPELKYVIHVAIVIPPKVPVKPVPRRMESIIQKCAKLRLSPAHMHPKQEDTDSPSTLILTAVPGNQHADESDDRKTRELCFVNIQRKLRNRGVSLRHQFPDIYNKLIDFVSDAKHFSPMIIYPTDNRTGKRFMCVIMPEAEPEIEWIRDPDLFHELDVFDDEAPEMSTPNTSVLQQAEIML